MDKHQLHAIISGQVQGVNFRHTTVQKARSLGLTGWVRNRPDGTVEVTAEGQRRQLEELLAFLHDGPPAAYVTGVENDWFPPDGDYQDFSIRHR